MAFGGDKESEDVRRLLEAVLTLETAISSAIRRVFHGSAYSSDSSRVLFPNEPISLLSSIALLSISASSYAASRLFIVARRFPFREPALCLDFPSLFLDLSRFDPEEEGSGEDASRTGRYRDDRGL